MTNIVYYSDDDQIPSLIEYMSDNNDGRQDYYVTWAFNEREPDDEYVVKYLTV